MTTSRQNPILRFIQNHGDRHITQEAFDYYKDETNPFYGCFEWADEKFDGVSFLAKRRILVGLSFSAVVDGVVKYSITVVHRNFRNQGIGTNLLKKKLASLEKSGYTYSTLVAEDNAPSNRMCEKSGLQEVERIRLRRRRGKFSAVHYTNGESNNENSSNGMPEVRKR